MKDKKQKHAEKPIKKKDEDADDDYWVDHYDVITIWIFLPFKDWVNPYKDQKM